MASTGWVRAAAGVWLVLSWLMPGTPAQAQTPHIPLEVGLVTVNVSHFEGQDYEVVSTVTALDDETATFSLHRVQRAGTALEPLTIVRVIRREDLREANRMVGYFHVKDPEMFPGSTAGQASTALLEKLKSGAATPFVFGMATGGLWSLGARKYYRGDLKVVEPAPVPMAVLLDGERTELPAVHVKGTLAVGNDVAEGEFWFLDQPDYPMTLRWTFKDVVVQVIRIDRPTAAGEEPAAKVGAALASDACRAELHGIYFDTGSATLLEPSAATIAEVAALLQREPEWRITIEGHTDSIGSEADNQALSLARAEAVRTALVEGYGVDPERLSIAGFGETRPVESNDTVEGRARNRRVELSRECP